MNGGTSAKLRLEPQSVARTSTSSSSAPGAASAPAAVAASPPAVSVFSAGFSKTKKKETVDSYKQTEHMNTALVNLQSVSDSHFTGIGGLNLRNLCSVITVDKQTRQTNVSRVLAPFIRDKSVSPEVNTHTRIIFDCLH